MHARITEVIRATEMLRGTIAGIACDYELTDVEIAAIKNWLELHANLLHKEPFKGLSELLVRILADGVVDPDEREELLEWCMEFSSPDSVGFVTVTNAIRQLHGFLQGIAIDKNITDNEIRDLQDWLRDYRGVREYWPFDDIWALVEEILADGEVSEDERAKLLEYCEQFSELPADPKAVCDTPENTYMICGAPVVYSVDVVCETNPVIEFKDKLYCFTGNAASGPRSTLHEIVRNLGGDIRNGVVQDLDYLVIGGLSQPAWAFSTYGRKVESARERQKAGAPLQIIHEMQFIEAVERATQSQKS